MLTEQSVEKNHGRKCRGSFCKKTRKNRETTKIVQKYVLSYYA